jgi:tRNA (mo5U34)-methyltransferase
MLRSKLMRQSVASVLPVYANGFETCRSDGMELPLPPLSVTCSFLVKASSTSGSHNVVAEEGQMITAETQQRIDAHRWYHEIDFGNGLRSESKAPERGFHRKLWRFIELQLDLIDFRGKSVLDIGCWDGYWSFYAERRGATEVVALDDFTQNWSTPAGIYLAKELLESKIEIIPDWSVYDLGKFGRRFDVILYLGVYYHLWDPFYAFTQVRHCCRAGAKVAVEGNLCVAMPQKAMYLSASIFNSKFLPSEGALEEMLLASYMRPIKVARLDPSVGADKWTALQRGEFWGQYPPVGIDRVLITAEAFDNINNVHQYEPPFGLRLYDPRFANKAV